MTDGNEPYKYDLALREWERQGLVSDRNNDDFVYYHEDLNEYRLGRYLLTFDQLGLYTTGGYVIVDKLAGPLYDPHKLSVVGEIIGIKTETVGSSRRPGYWIVLNLGKVEIVPGSNTHKLVRVENT